MFSQSIFPNAHFTAVIVVSSDEHAEQRETDEPQGRGNAAGHARSIGVGRQEDQKKPTSGNPAIGDLRQAIMKPTKIVATIRAYGATGVRLRQRTINRAAGNQWRRTP